MPNTWEWHCSAVFSRNSGINGLCPKMCRLASGHICYFSGQEMARRKRQEGMAVMSVRVPADELKRVRRVAEAECRTVSGHILFLVRRDLEEREKTWSQ